MDVLHMFLLRGKGWTIVCNKRGTVMEQGADLSSVIGGLRGRRVTPRWFKPGVVPSQEDSTVYVGRDGSSGWSVFVHYINAKGEASQRRLTCQKLMGYGADIESVFAYCHESKALKRFRIDSMQELYDMVTGEVVDPAEHFSDLHQRGLMRLKDRALDDFAKVLVFLAQCDGEFHPLERGALEDAFSRYCVRFGGDDCDVTDIMKKLKGIAPDSVDMIASVKRLMKASNAPAVARLLLSSMSEVVQADGTLAAEELEWSGFLQLKLRRAANA